MVNVKDVKYGTTNRKSFSRINEVMQMPNLIEIQKNSYNWFIEEGIKEVFEDLGTITDFNQKLKIEFVDYSFEKEPKYPIAECKARDATYSKRMLAHVVLTNNETGEVKDKYDLFVCDMPLMTDAGTFVVNGAERCVVSQLVRSAGVYFGLDTDKTGKNLYTSQVIPGRGAWLEYETDSNDIFYVKVDKNKKLPVTTFVRALGLNSDADIVEMFGEEPMLEVTFDKDGTKNSDEAKLEVYRKLRPGDPATIESATNQIERILFDPRQYEITRVGRYKYNKKLALSTRIEGKTLAEPVISPEGEFLFDAGEFIDSEKALEIENAGVNSVVIKIDDEKNFKVVSNGMVDITKYIEDLDLEKLRINERVSYRVLRSILDKCGDDRAALEEEISINRKTLIPVTVTRDDIYASVSYLLGIQYGVGTVDDIDHLGNRRIRSVGELVMNRFKVGFNKIVGSVYDHMSTIQTQDDKGEELTPEKLINVKPIQMEMKEFFGSSQLSQFMDQNNPLAEITSKRRLSSLGPGGLSRERAGFEVRDVHYTHYGRMCPIETPEGPTIGLITYLSSYSKIDEYGFIMAPYRKIDKETGKVTDEVRYMTADEEDNYKIAQANEELDEDNCFVASRITCRYGDTFKDVRPKEVDYMDVSPKMVVSVATAMIPFLEHDEAHRSLMGANMQRQAVPLLKTEAPVVATGMEYKAAYDSGTVVVSKRAGTVVSVDADLIEIKTKKGEIDKYNLVKFEGSNQGTCINQSPIVSLHQEIEEGQVIADGPATDNGEISLGKNALIGFTTWEGYNYEDAVIISERLVREDTYTSIHIIKKDIEARKTKLGDEEITSDIPNISKDAIEDLDENGIIRVGAEVRAGDILVGKTTPKGETELTPERRLLNSIFGQKAREVRDTSLRVSHGEYGIVVDVKVFTRENCKELKPGVEKRIRVYIAQKRKIQVGDKMAGRHGNKGVVSKVVPMEDMPFLPDGRPLDILLNPLGVPSRMNVGQVLEVHLGYAAKALGWKVATPVFDGASNNDIQECLKLADLGYYYDENGNQVFDGKSTLIDGRTGQTFDNRVTVGYMYFLKLHHLVDDKIHARSQGTYSLVTQQPLGGKAQFGGQRFGEMEVWALEAYGAAYTLQEMLTVKSDDISGRNNTFKAIEEGKNIPQAGRPEAFKVLLKELKSLALDVRLFNDDNYEVELKQDYDYEIDAKPEDKSEADSLVVENDFSEGFTVKNADGTDADTSEPEAVYSESIDFE